MLVFSFAGGAVSRVLQPAKRAAKTRIDIILYIFIFGGVSPLWLWRCVDGANPVLTHRGILRKTAPERQPIMDVPIMNVLLLAARAILTGPLPWRARPPYARATMPPKTQN
jgi:hypothetical protein